MRRCFLAALGAACFFVAAFEATADSSCDTRNRCRWWRAEFVAKASAGCWPLSTLCSSRSSSCGVAVTSCGPKTCIHGQSNAWARNSSAGCQTGGYRSGWGRYGEPVPGAEEPDVASKGDHEVESRVEFDEVSRSVLVHLDRVYMSATVDSSFSRLDVFLYLDSAEPTDEEIEPTPSNTVWHGFLMSQGGELTQQGFEEEARGFTSDGRITTLELEGVTKAIAFEGSDEDWERLTVRVFTDGGAG
ncbi:MAG: hypothetical protein K0U98_18175 [Deltaproteobacteria bacterium]|nr:hypothetical protein [Deltaproteobacteria bacterium]